MVINKNNIVISSGTLSLTEDGILIVKMNENTEIDIPQVKEQHEAASILTQDKKHAVLFDGRGSVTSTPEARAYGVSPELYTNIIAQAILVNTLANKIGGNFYIKFNKPPVPAKLFTTKKGAMDWLREHLKKAGLL